MLEELIYLIIYCCVTILLKSYKSLKFLYFACLWSGTGVHAEEAAQCGQKNMHSPVWLHEHVMSTSFSFTQAYWSLHGSILRDRKKLDTREALALHCIDLVYARMKMNLVMVLGMADWFINAFSFPLYFWMFQMFPFLEAKLVESPQVEFAEQIPSSKRSIDWVEIVSLFPFFFPPENWKGSD